MYKLSISLLFWHLNVDCSILKKYYLCVLKTTHKEHLQFYRYTCGHGDLNEKKRVETQQGKWYNTACPPKPYSLIIIYSSLYFLQSVISAIKLGQKYKRQPSFQNLP